MPVSLDNLPNDANGGLEGLWVFQLRQNLHGGHGGAQFADGRTTTPVDARTFKQFVAGMGQDIVGALRIGDQYAIGDVSTLRPNNYDELHSKSLEAQDSNKLLEQRAADLAKKESGDNPLVPHALAGAKFETPERAAARTAFSEAAGDKVEQTASGPTVTATAADGSQVHSGGEPVLDPNAPPPDTSQVEDQGSPSAPAPTDLPSNTIDGGAPVPTTSDPPSATETTTKKKRW